MPKRIIGLAAVFLSLFFLQAQGAAAQTVDLPCKTDTIINVIARDGDQKFIPNINFEIYEQIDDVDGNPKPDPTKKVGAGKTDAVLGKGTIRFRLPKLSDLHQYAIKIWQTNSANSFYFYDYITAGCGYEINSTVVLSSFKVILRDADGNLKTNTAFSMYAQKQDADDNPIKEKGALVGTYNTGSAGGYTLYLPSKERNIVNWKGTEEYVLEVKNAKNYLFTKYNLRTSDGSAATVEYVLSRLKLIFKGASGNPLVKGSKVDLYVQEEGLDGGPALGKSVASLLTDDNGAVSLEYPPGLYAAVIIGADKKQKIFYDLGLAEGGEDAYEISTDGTFVGEKNCDPLNFTLHAKKLSGEMISGLKYQIYERANGSNGSFVAGALLSSGELDANGESKIQITPNSEKYYILKIYGDNASVGDFWFFDNLQFVCGQDKELTKFLPTLRIILRKANGDLLKGQKFSLYAQETDENSNPSYAKTGLVKDSFTTNESGFAEIFLAGEHLYDKTKKGNYALVVPGKNKLNYAQWGVVINMGEDKTVDYALSDVSLLLQDAAKNPLKKKAFSFFKQKWTTSESKKGDAAGTFVTNDSGVAIIENPGGTYVLTMKDDLGTDFEIPSILIKDNIRSDAKATTNLTKVAVADNSGKAIGLSNVDIYSLLKSAENKYQRNKKIKTIKTPASGVSELILAPGAYLFETLAADKSSYGRVALIKNGQVQNISINSAKDKVTASQIFSLSDTTLANSLTEKVKGYILLQVEAHGEAWYVDPVQKKRFYFKDGVAAYAAMRKFGLGIKSLDLAKIPVGLDGSPDDDADGDSLSDKLEESIGTDPNNQDTDGDGFKDGAEVFAGYDPSSSSKAKKIFDKALAERLKGRILLQVESSGRAWYINPKDGKRYYMKDGDTAYKIMRQFGLGITDANLETITAETLEQ